MADDPRILSDNARRVIDSTLALDHDLELAVAQRDELQRQLDALREQFDALQAEHELALQQ